MSENVVTRKRSRGIAAWVAAAALLLSGIPLRAACATTCCCGPMLKAAAVQDHQVDSLRAPHSCCCGGQTATCSVEEGDPQGELPGVAPSAPRVQTLDGSATAAVLPTVDSPQRRGPALLVWQREPGMPADSPLFLRHQSFIC